MKKSPPLLGKQVVVTRPEGDAGALAGHLATLGAGVIYWPTIQFLPPIDDRPLRRALSRLGDYDWIVLSSPRVVEAVTDCAAQPASGTRVASVGSATSAALRAEGWTVDLEAEPARGAALVAAMGELGCEGARVLFPASAIARATIPRGLESQGAQVDQVIAYRNVPAELDREACRLPIESRQIAAVTFASPSAAEGLEEALGDELFERLMCNAAKIAIGPTTATALEHLGYAADAIADKGDLTALAEAVEKGLSKHSYLSRRP